MWRVLALVSLLAASCTTSHDEENPHLRPQPEWLTQRLESHPDLLDPLPLLEPERPNPDVKPVGRGVNVREQPDALSPVSTESSESPQSPSAVIRSPARPRTESSRTDRNPGRHPGGSGQRPQQTPTVRMQIMPQMTPTPPPRPQPQGLSRIEMLYNEQTGLSRNRRLRQYGYGFFNRPMVAEVNRGAPADYKLGAGDEVQILSTGGLELNSKQMVSPEGNLFLDPVGAVPVAGIQAGDLSRVLREALNREVVDFQLEATVTTLRPVRVRITGFVGEPGLYLVPANSTLIEALSRAGGPTKNGSLRNLRLIRPGQEDVPYDLYDLIRTGKGIELLLREGDTLQVDPVGSTVAVMGPLMPGIYEFLPTENLGDLVTVAGDWNAFVQRDLILLERSGPDQRRTITSCTFPDQQDLALKDGDVFSFQRTEAELQRTVEIIGAVVRPGRYPWKEGMTLSELLRMADGFRLEASLDQAAIQRQLHRGEQFDITPGDGQGDLMVQVVWADLGQVLEEGPDVRLHNLDRIKIYRREEVQPNATVRIQGAVQREGTYRLAAGMTLSDLFSLAGGLEEDAFLGEGTLVRRSKENDPTQLDVNSSTFSVRDLVTGGPDALIALENGDTVVIRRIQKMFVRTRVTGRVRFPGDYMLPQGSTISDLLVMAGGLMDDADLRAAVFSRERVRQLQQARLDQMMSSTEERYARNREIMTRAGKGGEATAGQLGLLGLNRIAINTARYQAQGRVVVDLLDPEFESSTHNLTLENGDRLDIPQTSVTVTVIGRVFSPNTFVWEKGKDVGDYIDKTGGLMDDAHKSEMYAILANGEVRSAAQSMGVGGFKKYKPGPGDTILIPTKPVKRSPMSQLSDALMVAQQAANLGLTTAAIPQVMDSEVSTIDVTPPTGNPVPSGGGVNLDSGDNLYTEPAPLF